jgi:hypothetical protein
MQRLTKRTKAVQTMPVKWGGSREVIGGGGGEVVGQEKKGVNDDVVVAAAVPETKGNVDVADAMVGDDVADALVDNKKISSVDDVSAQESDSNEIDRMQNRMRRSFLSRKYKEAWGIAHRSQSSASDNPDNASDVTANVDKADVGSVDKDETESDDVDEEEDTNKDVQVKLDDGSSYVPGISLGNNDEDEDNAVGDINNNAVNVGADEDVEDVIVAEDEVVGVESRIKKQKLHYDAWVNNYNMMVSFYNTNGHCIAKRNVPTAEGRKLGNWVHDQRKKFKGGTLSDDRITLLFDLQFDFSMQTNVVKQKLTVPVAISRIFKYKKEHGNVAVPNREPHKQLQRWIVHAKATSKKIIAQGSGNPKFTLPNLKLLHQLGIIQLPPDFKLLERTTTTTSATKK